MYYYEVIGLYEKYETTTTSLDIPHEVCKYSVLIEALVAKVTKGFSHRLAPLNMFVKELSDSMQLSKIEHEETQGYGGKKRKKNNDGGENSKPRDVVHVRAKRGEATYSHSLAERMRREKINEKLRRLQDRSDDGNVSDVGGNNQLRAIIAESDRCLIGKYPFKRSTQSSSHEVIAPAGVK
ncbi:hypothetical protein LXL04_024958 [Taraxacum kok-saghyz]